MSIIKLSDTKITPDIIQEYPESLRDSGIPIVIDNGSYQCRVGFANQESPSMVFKNLIAKPRKDRTKKDAENINPPIQIGNDIVNIEALRFQLKTQFDRNVVTHYYIQEQIFDYIFTHLGIDTEKCVKHPIVLTECFGNPNYCRQLMSELLFECYDVPSVCYGVDSLYSFKYNSGVNGLIISCGFHSTHVIPVLNGNAINHKSRRINLGGYHMISYLHRLFQLKYPVHVNAITLSRVEKMLHEYCSIANNYMTELHNWSFFDFYEENVKKIQLPYTLPVHAPVLSAEQKFEKKRELAKRLADINARKREERLAENEELLSALLHARDLHEDKATSEFKSALKEQNLSSFEELEKMIITVKTRIERTKQKIAMVESGIVQIVEEKPKQIIQPPAELAVDDWIFQTKQKRTALLDRRHARKKKKQDLAKRRTAAAQERMRIISQLARKEKGTDDFGMRDEDWDIYKTISREGGDSDSEIENEKLMEFEEVLRHHDPTFEEPQMIQGAAESYQLHFGLEAIRTPELLFQPSMIGSSEAGLAETIEFVLKMFSPEEQLILANNVFLTGGSSTFPGLEERLSRELMEIRPFQSPHRITKAKNQFLDAWNGAKDFANTSNLSEYLITKQIYDEMGGEYLKAHYASNQYFPTPAPITEINE